MATIIAAAGGGNWSVGATWVGGVVPTAADNVQLTSTSGAVTINAAAVCRSLDCSTYTGTLTHAASITLSIGDATAGTGNIALRLVSGMTYTVNSNATITFVSTSATVQTIDTGGKSLGTTMFNATSNGSWQLTSSLNVPGTLALTRGTFDTNNQTITTGTFSSNNGNVRTLTFGSSAIDCNSFNMTTATNATFTANTAVVTASAGNGSVTLHTANTNGMSIVLGAVNMSLVSSGATIANLTRVGSGASADNLTFNGNVTITGTLTLTGSSVSSRIHVLSAVIGTAQYHNGRCGLTC